MGISMMKVKNFTKTDGRNDDDADLSDSINSDDINDKI